MITARLGHSEIIGTTPPDMTYINGEADRVKLALKGAFTSVMSKVAPGLSPEQLPSFLFAVYQSAHETDFWQSPAWKTQNNGSGIKYAKWEKGASPGQTYATFDNIDDWAAALVHLLQKGAAKAPILATTLEDYAQRLKDNNYYGDTVSNYITGMKNARIVLTDIPAEQNATGPYTAAQATQALQEVKQFNLNQAESLWQKLPLWGKIGVGVGAFLVVKKIID